MKKQLIAFGTCVLFLCAFLFTSAQLQTNENLRLNGMYIGKTLEIQVGDNTIETYNYLRFYSDGSVICQSVSGKDSEAVAVWFHTEDGGRFERKGTYAINGNQLNFKVNNDNTEDQKLEGDKTDVYEGSIIGPDQLYLTLTYSSGKVVETVYEFSAFTSK